MKKDNIIVLPQDTPVEITNIIRKDDPEATIFPMSIILSEGSKHFTKEEIKFIIHRQKELFNLSPNNIRVFAIRSKALTQEKVSSFLYHI